MNKSKWMTATMVAVCVGVAFGAGWWAGWCNGYKRADRVMEGTGYVFRDLKIDIEILSATLAQIKALGSYEAYAKVHGDLDLEGTANTIREMRIENKKVWATIDAIKAAGSYQAYRNNLTKGSAAARSTATPRSEPRKSLRTSPPLAPRHASKGGAPARQRTRPPTEGAHMQPGGVPQRKRTRPPNAGVTMQRGGEPAKTAPAGDGFTLRGSMAWLEVNGRGIDPFSLWPDAVGVRRGRTYLEYCDLGIRDLHFASMVDVIVTTTRFEIVAIYTHLTDTWSKRGVRIIGGIKTYAYFTATDNPASDAKDYAITDPVGWQNIRDDCEQIAMITGVDLCVIESETALSNWHLGKQEIELAELAVGLFSLVGSPVRFAFNLPAVIQTSGRTEDETAAMVELFAAVPLSIFITGHQSRPKYLDHPEMQSRRDRMIQILGDRSRLWGKCYTGAEPDGGNAFGLEAAVAHFKTIPERLVLYPGGSKWGEIGRKALILTLQTRPGSSRPKWYP